MRTSLDCLPCLYKQALFTVRLCSIDPEIHRKALTRVSLVLNDLDLTLSPPENSVSVYRSVAELCKTNDPFAEIKKKSNDIALSMRPDILTRINNSKDPLYTAIKCSIAGNIIDYGSHQEFNIEETLNRCILDQPVIDDYDIFKTDLKKAASILYLTDNCGEIVFDGILIDKLGKHVNLAVKDQPIINDALIEDAFYCGLDKVSSIISNGTDCPGTPIGKCSSSFEDIFNKADLIISKGQGNFETLSEINKPVYFLLQVKCPIVARHVESLSARGKRIKVGQMVFMKMVEITDRNI